MGIVLITIFYYLLGIHNFMINEEKYSVKDFRQLFGNFPTGVTVIGMNENGISKGITANSITSVSLKPMLLLACIDKNAASHEVLKRVGHFSINFLSNEQKDASRFFANPSSDTNNSMGGFSFLLGNNGSPILDDVIGWVECKISSWYEGGDHSIVLGEVTNMKIQDENLKPLVYYNGEYSEIA